MDPDIGALPWWGGKHPQHAAGPGRWIAGLLASQTPTTYVEPFAGMLGILLQRPPAPVEIAADIDAEMVNWWRTVQRQPDDLAAMIDRTTPSEEVHAAEVERYADPDRTPLQRAYGMTVVLWLCRTGVRTMYNTAGKHLASATLQARILRCSKRVQRVDIQLRNAADVLAEHHTDPGALIYCDPPFVGTMNTSYTLGSAKLNEYDAEVNDCDALDWLLRPDTAAHIALSTQQRLPGPHVHDRPTVHRAGVMGQKRRRRADRLVSNRPLDDPAPKLPGIIEEPTTFTPAPLVST